MDSTTAYEKIQLFFRKHRRSPSYREISSLMGFASKNAGFKLVKQLIVEGLIETDTSGKIILPSLSPLTIPLMGIIKAGSPTDPMETPTEPLTLDTLLVSHPDRSFALRVSGDSMIDAGIHGGDLAIIEKARFPKNGDIVAAFVDSEVTLKYFEKNAAGTIRLMPANPLYRPITPKRELSIMGVVVSIIRTYR